MNIKTQILISIAIILIFIGGIFIGNDFGKNKYLVEGYWDGYEEG